MGFDSLFSFIKAGEDGSSQMLRHRSFVVINGPKTVGVLSLEVNFVAVRQCENAVVLRLVS
jgi:hypothetical protein